MMAVPASEICGMVYNSRIPGLGLLLPGKKKTVYGHFSIISKTTTIIRVVSAQLVIISIHYIKFIFQK